MTTKEQTAGIRWAPMPAQRNLGRGQIPMPRHGEITVNGKTIATIREGYGSRFGRTYDAFNLSGGMIARNASLKTAIAAAEARANG